MIQRESAQPAPAGFEDADSSQGDDYRPPSLMRPDAIAARIKEMATAGVKVGRMVVESGISRPDLEAWIKGNRDKKTSALLSMWLQGMDEELEKGRGQLVFTPTVEKILDAFEKAREARGGGKRGIAAVFGASGAGKTAAAKWQEMTDKGVVYVIIDGETKTYVSILKAVLAKKSQWGHPATGESVTNAILREMRAGDLIILDHAHILPLRVIESLIPFPDEYGIALALIGNTKGYKSLMDAKTMQINSRIGGALVFVEIPGEEDVDAILAAEGISGRLAREMCQVIGRQEGGLRTLYETIREARKLQKAAGAARLDERLLKLGAHNAGHWGAQS